jgi:hypothetical protein
MSPTPGPAAFHRRRGRICIGEGWESTINNDAARRLMIAGAALGATST